MQRKIRQSCSSNFQLLAMKTVQIGCIKCQMTIEYDQHKSLSNKNSLIKLSEI